MLVKDLMTRNPVCSTPGTPLPDIARMMVEHRCGAIPVVKDLTHKKLAGIVTDRDIVCRSIARDKDPMGSSAGDVMSSPAVFVRPEAGLEDCLDIMEENQVRRLLVVDDKGSVVGLVTQAQVSRYASDQQTARLVRDVSRKTDAASAVGAGR